MAAKNVDGRAPWRRVLLLLQLQQQTFGQVPGGDARRVEVLHEFHDCLDFGDFARQMRRQRPAQFLRAGAQHAVVVDAVDDGMGDQPVAVGHRRHIELPVQVVEQRARGAVAFLEAAVVFGGGLGGGGADRLVDVVPGDVHRQVFRNGFQVFGRVALVGVFLLVALRGIERIHRVGFRIFGLVLVLRLGELQHGIGLERLAHLHAHFGCRELHHANRLAQLRRHRQLLAEAQRQRLLHHSRNCSPR